MPARGQLLPAPSAVFVPSGLLLQFTAGSSPPRRRVMPHPKPWQPRCLPSPVGHDRMTRSGRCLLDGCLLAVTGMGLGDTDIPLVSLRLLCDFDTHKPIGIAGWFGQSARWGHLYLRRCLCCLYKGQGDWVGVGGLSYIILLHLV